MDWKELKHKINMEMLSFEREFHYKPNILILGKKEYYVIQWWHPTDNPRKNILEEYERDAGMINGEIAKVWGMKICRVDEESMIKAGYIA